MKTRVEKLERRSWIVFVNGQRHDEIFVTPRREAKRQKETNKIDNQS